MSNVLENRMLAKVAFRINGHKHPIANFTDSRFLDNLFASHPSGTEGFKYFHKGYEFSTTEGNRFRVVDIFVEYFGPIMEMLGNTKYGVNMTSIDEEEKETNLYVDIIMEEI